MKRAKPILLVFILTMICCTEAMPPQEVKSLISDHPSPEVPDEILDLSLLHYDNTVSLWLLDGQPCSGFILRYYPDGSLKEKTGLLNGKRQNKSTKWYPDGNLKEVAHFHEGKLHGSKKRWSTGSSHVLLAHLNYQFGSAHGTQKQWYPTGERYKILNLEMGKEEGMQQAFRKNGELYANYEAKVGRIFGLKKAALCYGLEDENINYEE